MSTATAKRPSKKKAATNGRALAYGGTLGFASMAAKPKPSCALSADGTRPILTHAYITERAGSMWLCATDSYQAVVLRLPDGTGLREGFVPAGALKLMERGWDGTQESRHAWRVAMPDGYVTFDVAAHVGFDAAYPDFDKLGVWPPRKRDATSTADIAAFGFNPKLAKKIGDALGSANGMRFEVTGPLKPIRCYPLNVTDDDRYGLLMPIRVST